MSEHADKQIAECIGELQTAKRLDPEAAHIRADRALCTLLESLGMEEVVTEFNSIRKYYA